ncbi:MAG: DUF512 domain-containing protein [Clostridiales bacterium]|jgi:putative radical SAM enzyme (TIGR03279 family)|nr:DUF512 domain-containing protein [Clostridiales bacterium]
MEHPLIIACDSGSPAHRAGITPGERLISINDNPIADVLDYMYHSAEGSLSMELIDQNGKRRRVNIIREGYEPIGLSFETYLMDKPRACANKCIFCFIDQLPKGLRKTLYFKDDDARLSFLMGNYITLTNLTERELQRIIDLKISPVNISVHTTNPELRSFMLQNKKAAEGYQIMRRLAAAGISMNCQIVIVPSINDADELERSMRDLISLFPQVASVSVVPVGITKYRQGLHPISPCTGKEAADIIKAVDSFGNMCLEKYGTRVFYCGDELYLKAGLPLPPYEYYEDFPQYENGVGMLRALEYEFRAEIEKIELPSKISPFSFSVATGAAAEGLLINLLQIIENKCYNIKGSVFKIRNNFFGEHVDVAGLITGGDIMSQLRDKPLGERLLIPACMLRHGGDLFLDDVSLGELENALNVPILPVPNDGAMLARAMLGQKL